MKKLKKNQAFNLILIFGLTICFSNLGFTETPGTQESKPSTNCEIRYISGAGVKLRATDSATAKVPFVMKFNSKVCVDEIKDTWVRVHDIEDANRSGWTQISLLSTLKFIEKNVVARVESASGENKIDEVITWAERLVDMNESIENLQRLKEAVAKKGDLARVVLIEKRISSILSEISETAMIAEYINAMKSNKILDATTWAERIVGRKESIKNLKLLKDVLVKNNDIAGSSKIKMRMQEVLQQQVKQYSNYDFKSYPRCPTPLSMLVSPPQGIGPGEIIEAKLVGIDISDNLVTCKYNSEWLVHDGSICPASQKINWGLFPSVFKADSTNGQVGVISKGEIGTSNGQIPYCFIQGAQTLTYQLSKEIQCDKPEHFQKFLLCRKKQAIASGDFDCGYFLNKQRGSGFYPTKEENVWESAQSENTQIKPNYLIQKQIKLGTKKLFICESYEYKDGPIDFIQLINSHGQTGAHVSYALDHLNGNQLIFKPSNNKSRHILKEPDPLFYCENSDKFSETPCPVYKKQSLDDPSAKCEQDSTDQFLNERAESLVLKADKKNSEAILGFYDCVNILSNRMSDKIQVLPREVQHKCNEFPFNDFDIFKFWKTHKEKFNCWGGGEVMACTCSPSPNILNPILHSEGAETRRYSGLGLEYVDFSGEGCGDGDCPDPDSSLTILRSLCGSFKTTLVRNRIKQDLATYLKSLASEHPEFKDYQKSVAQILSNECK